MQKDDIIYLEKNFLRQVGRIAPLGVRIPE